MRSFVLLLAAVSAGVSQELPATYEVTARSGLNVRLAPHETGERAGALPRGAEVEVAAFRDGWAELAGDGANRFVSADYLTPAGASLVGTHRLQGQDSRRGAYTLELQVQRVEDGELHVRRVATYAEAREGTRGKGWVRGGVLRVTLAESLGLDGALEGGQVSQPVVLELRRGADGALVAHEVSPRGEGAAKGEAPRPADPADQDRGSGSLLAVGADKLGQAVRRQGEKLLYDGVRLRQEVGLGRYLHVGAGGEIRGLRGSDLTPAQAETLGQRPGHVWLESEVFGGARVPLSTQIPLSDSSSLRLGFEAGTRIDYTVTDLYRVPAGVTDLGTMVRTLQGMGTRAFDLPLRAGEAQRMTPGAKRVFEGSAHVAVDGRFQVGHSFGQAGALRFGATAGVGGFYRISGRHRIEVERLSGSAVRVRVRRGRTTSRGVTADVVLGASLDGEAILEALPELTEYVGQAEIDGGKLSAEGRAALVAAGISVADGVVRKLLRVRVAANASATTIRDDLDLTYRFDLGNSAARQAYERAVRGDFTAASTQAAGGRGVIMERRHVGVERRTHVGASLQVSQVLSASVSRTTSLANGTIDEPLGTSTYDVGRYERDSEFSFFSSERERRIDFEIVRRTRAQRTERSLRFRVEILDPSTFTKEALGFRRLVGDWGMNHVSQLGARNDADGLRGRYRQTRTVVELRIGENGLRRLFANSEAGYFAAYARAWQVYHGEAPTWATRHGQISVQGGEDDDAKRELRRAEEFARHMAVLAGNPSDRAKRRALNVVAGSAKYGLFGLAALSYLVPRDQISLDASMVGNRIRVVDRYRGANADFVRDPRD
ncbi:MAG: hypothetical protein R3F62_17290 [Planctomycetota bacterium]